MAPRGSGAATSGGNGDGCGERYRWKSIEKRTRGLCKKAYELATLCYIDVALVCNLPGVDTPTIWPPDRHEIEEVIHRYHDTPADKKNPKNQITLHIPNPAAENIKDAGETAANPKNQITLHIPNPAAENIPFPSDEDKLRAVVRYLDSKIAEVRRMIAARRMERRSEPALSPGDRGQKMALYTAPALPAASGGDGDGHPGTADRERGKRVARDHDPVWGSGRPDFSALVAASGGVGAPNSSPPCPCCYCPYHRHWFTRFDGRNASRDGSDGN